MRKTVLLWSLVAFAAIGIAILKIFSFQECRSSGFSALYCLSQLW